MRLLSLTAGSIVLIGGLYVAVGERMAGTSADATVNARITTLRAPIEGTVCLYATSAPVWKRTKWSPKFSIRVTIPFVC